MSAILTTISTTADILTIGGWAYKLSIWDKFLSKLKRHKKILVLGISGNGKTTFLCSLFNDNGVEVSRTHTERITTIKLNREYIDFIDTPGHVTYEVVRQKSEERISRGEIDGIINVVSYGYASTEDANVNDVFKTSSSGETAHQEVKDDYLKLNRKNELNQLNEWIRFVKTGYNLKWILTLVNKEDIWVSQKEEVMNYYNGGEYGESLASRKVVCNSSLLIPYCSGISGFMGHSIAVKYREQEVQKRKKELLELLKDLLYEKTE